jgi:formylglycine-generating enzyme required for sulfatase activity
MGSDTSKDSYSYKDEMPRHKVILDPYFIGKYCVSNRQYKVFVEATGYFQPIFWEDGKISHGKEDHPVVGITWQDAINFCKWLSYINGKQVRLPTEAEWENAARGSDGRRFPWSDKLPDPTLCNFNWSIGDTTPVGHYSPKGDGPYGCADQAGNVREFVADAYEENYYLESPANNPRGPAIGTLKSLRGGSWCSLDTNCRSARRDVVGESMFEIDIGFRCAIFS